MKKTIILVLASLLSICAISQTDSTKHYFSHYICIGESMTNNSPVNTFKYASYPSIENGIMHNNLGFGLVLGYKNFNKVCSSIDSVYYEFKMFTTFPIGGVTGTLLFGYGGYFSVNSNFIEYGIGISYNVGNFAYGVTYSNWGGTNYITPSLTYNF